MNDYPARVTFFEDGIYRWSYDMDLWHDRYILRLVIKVLLLVMGIPTLFVLAMLLKNLIPLLKSGLPGERIMFFIRNDLLIVAIVGGLLVGMILLTLLIYIIAAAVVHGKYHLCYQMDESAVALVREPRKMDALNTFGTVVAVVGLAIGKPGDAMRIGSTLAVAKNTGTSRFESTRRVKILPERDLLDLREWFGMNQIYVPGEDYGFVKDFILERIPQKARDRSRM